MNKLHQFMSIDFVKHNAIFFTGTLAISFFNYIFYPVVGRLVSVQDFGEVQASISLFMQFGLILTAFGYVVIGIAATKKGKDRQNAILYLEKITLYASLLLLICLSIFGPLFQAAFQLTSVIPLVLIGLLVILNIPSTARTYILQEGKRLKEVSVSGIIFASSKLGLAVLFIIIGLRVEGVLLAYLIAQFLTIIYLDRKTHGTFPNSLAGLKLQKCLKAPAGIRADLYFGLAVIVILSGAAILYSFDVVVARLFLSTIEAGEYSGISSVARIIYFATASVAGVLIATVKPGESIRESRKSLRQSFLLVGILGGVITLFFTAFPSFATKFLIGGSYEHVSSLLPIVSLVMLICAINNLLILFQIALREYRSIYAIISAVLFLVVYLLIRHETVYDLIYAYLFSNILLAALLLVQILMKKEGSGHEQDIAISGATKL